MNSDLILTVFTDGGARGNPGPAAIGVWVVDRQGNEVYQEATAIGESTNNEAEYQAFWHSVEWLVHQTELSPTRVEWKLDSMLVVEQLNRRWKIKEKRLLPLAQQIWDHLAQLPYPFTIAHVPRELNREADALVNQALDAVSAK